MVRDRGEITDHGGLSEHSFFKTNYTRVDKGELYSNNQLTRLMANNPEIANYSKNIFTGLIIRSLTDVNETKITIYSHIWVI